ncbi:MAG: S8 family serine peptidase [Verrucomicrobiae bacterium]|nr:S8 family serine peptidase [Verrucomicrobiae bacterium]MCP5540479.1 S8 family serine peptidase [Akkermansiaceae bacterium]
MTVGTGGSGARRRPGVWIGPDEAIAAIREGRGMGVRVAVIDSGVEANHPRLRGMRLADSVGFEESGGRLVPVDGAGHDVYGHGTAVAGIIHEFAPEAEIGSFRVIDARSLSRTALICAGVMEAMRRGYHVLNCSFGCKGLAKFLMPHKEWTDLAWRRGIHVVAASGGGDDEEAEWPSHLAGVFGVTLARTREEDIFHRPGAMVSFAARGEDVEVAWLGGETQLKTGTSFAAPRLTGRIARLLSVAPGLPVPLTHALLSAIAEPWTDVLDASW